MDEKSRDLESQLEADMMEDELCLLGGETASLYVSDVSVASLPNGEFSFSLAGDASNISVVFIAVWYFVAGLAWW